MITTSHSAAIIALDLPIATAMSAREVDVVMSIASGAYREVVITIIRSTAIESTPTN